MIYDITHYYLPAFYIILYLFTVGIGCIVIKTQTSFFSAIYLTAFVFAVSNEALWWDARSMAAFEMILLFTMFFVFEGKFGTRFMFITLLMIAVNVIADPFSDLPITNTIRPALINLLFFSLCGITLRASYNTRQLRKKKAELGNDSFYAFEKSVLPFQKMVQ